MKSKIMKHLSKHFKDTYNLWQEIHIFFFFFTDECTGRFDKSNGLD